ncbi:MAG: PilZ domain-containing protein [Oligoflexales bacterium]|nr:PilZ domain-containing protein [Oligoflexales bacterium]
MSEAKRKLSERENNRAAVLPTELSGTFSYSSLADGNENTQEKHEAFVIFDVSQNGLGLLTSCDLAKGTKLHLQIGRPFFISIEAVVAWSQACDDFGAFRCGVEIVSEPQKLKPLYLHFA